MNFALVPQAFAQAPGAGNATCNLDSSNLDLTECYRLGPAVTVGRVYDNPTVLVNLIVRNIFVVAGIFIFLMIIYAGWKFIEQGEKGQEEAKAILEAVLLGFFLMFSAYWIVKLVEIFVGQQILF